MEPENRPYVDASTEPGDAGTEEWADKLPDAGSPDARTARGSDGDATRTTSSKVRRRTNSSTTRAPSRHGTTPAKTPSYRRRLDSGQSSAPVALLAAIDAATRPAGVTALPSALCERGALAAVESSSSSVMSAKWSRSPRPAPRAVRTRRRRPKTPAGRARASRRCRGRCGASLAWSDRPPAGCEITGEHLRAVDLEDAARGVTAVNAVRTTAGSTPAARASVSPSATAAIVAPTMSWLHAFASCPAPEPPTWTIVRPIAAKTGLRPLERRRCRRRP